MRILCDESVPAQVERALEGVGHDVSAIRIQAPGSADLAVLKLAASEDRVLLTYDRDFGELTFRQLQRPAPTTVYVRLPARIVNDEVHRILEVLPFVETGYFLVVDSDGVRKRKIT